MQILSKPVSNYSKGRRGYRPQAIVIHIAQGTLPGAYSWFNNRSSYASSHYMVGKKGQIWKFVNETDTAWHAGGAAKPRWSLLKKNVNPNLYTIGIEHEGYTGQKWNNKMYQSSAWLIARICDRWNIPIDRKHIIRHSQINSVSRSGCPGKGVDFAKLISLAQEQLEDPEVIKELQQKIKELETIHSELSNRVSNLQLELATAKSENEKLKSQLNKSSNKNIKELMQQNQSLSEEVYRLQQIRDKFAEKVEKLEDEVQNLKTNSKGDIDSYTTGQLFSGLINKALPWR